MVSLTTHVFNLADLQTRPENKHFSDDSLPSLAGRCLLDAVEYIRIDLKWPGRFRQLTDAHAMRLVAMCLRALKRNDIMLRMKQRIEVTYNQILKTRKDHVPFYGDDFWDWASIIDALRAVGEAYPDLDDHDNVLCREVKSFYKDIKERLPLGLTCSDDGEWFGPATAAVAHRVLSQCRACIGDDQIENTLKTLKKQALMHIENKRYLQQKVSPNYHAWHYGQVICEFSGKESKWQQEQIKDLQSIESLNEKSDRVYALARVLQGAQKIGDEKIKSSALKSLYECQELQRPLGTGLISDNVKGSLNVLDAIWPMLNASDLENVNAMLDSLLVLYKAANTVGIVVAVDREAQACKKAFKLAGAQVQENAHEGSMQVDHKDYKAAILKGKSILGAAKATGDLIGNKYKARWLIMVGIAGTLGSRTSKEEKAKTGQSFRGPAKGDVVLATSTAGFEIRAKWRDEIENVGVPLDGIAWDILPVDPNFFSIAHKAAEDFSKRHEVHEGLIVTGNGIKDNLKEKQRILDRWPGGLAVEEEGFIVALVSTMQGIPHIVIRGISDLAEGDKIKQQGDKGAEEEDQRNAAEIAANLMVRVIQALSQKW